MRKGEKKECVTLNKQIDINNRRQTKKIYWVNRRQFGKKGTKRKASKEIKGNGVGEKKG